MKKVLFLFLGIVGIAVAIFYLYVWLFPSLDDQLFKATKEKCALQSFCKVHLHEITNFKWDKAYFFSSDNYYSNQDIKKLRVFPLIYKNIKLSRIRNTKL